MWMMSLCLWEQKFANNKTIVFYWSGIIQVAFHFLFHGHKQNQNPPTLTKAQSIK